MTRAWTEEERKRQSELMHRLKPWMKSTGPRTAEGKKKSSMNAFKHGTRSQAMKKVKAALRRHRAFLERYDAQSKAWYKAEKMRISNERSIKPAPIEPGPAQTAAPSASAGGSECQ